MNRFLLPAVLALAAAAPAQMALYEFENSDLASSDTDPTSVASDLVPSLPIMFYNRDGLDNLCLGNEWRNGGTIRFSVTATGGNSLYPTLLKMRSSTLQPSNNVLTAIAVYVNGEYAGRTTGIRNPDTIRTFDLRGISALQGVGQLNVELRVEGQNDNDMFEFDYIRMDGDGRGGPTIDPRVKAESSCKDDCFSINGTSLTSIDQVKIDGVDTNSSDWDYTVVSETRMEVCPPAARNPGNYRFEAFSNGQSVGTTTLTIVQGSFNVGYPSPDQLFTVTGECFELSGCDLSSIDELRFGGQVIHVGGSLGDGSWKLINDRLIEICPPQCLPPGQYSIKLYTNGSRRATRYVDLVEPTVPTISCQEEFEVEGDPQCIYIHDGGAPQPNLVFGVVSPSNRPSVMPGLIQLGIGDNFQMYFCNIGQQGPCVEYCVGSIPSILAGRTLYFQGAILVLDGSVLPIPVTEVCATTYVQN